jgi:hypothetical protein
VFQRFQRRVLHWADLEADRIVNDWGRSVFSTGETADAALRAEIALALRRARDRRRS